MDRRMLTRIGLVLVGAGLAAGCLALGRASVDTGAARDRGYRAGVGAGYASGVRDGLAEGVRDGRLLQGSQQLPPDVRGAYDAGYLAGTNDAFGGYDGGWSLGTPYVITLDGGHGGVTYRIVSRVELRPGVGYYLCPHSAEVCHEPRR